MKILITGGTNGMGFGLAKILAGDMDQKHEIIILGSSSENGKKAVAELNGISGNGKISFVLCDLTKLKDVKRASEELHKNHKFLDGIYINAGIGYAANQKITEDGMDPHFQVNYLSQFMLTLNLLDLLEKSEKGARVIFNVTKTGNINWEDVQMKKKWNFEKGIGQAMAAKRIFYNSLHNIYLNRKQGISFYGHQIHKTVWSNQVNLIPGFMLFMAKLVKLFGGFISIEDCGREIAPLFMEKKEQCIKRSSQLITWKKGNYIELKEEESVLDEPVQKRLWKLSLDLCRDDATARIAGELAALD